MMAWSNSMLLTLNAPSAYLPRNALANRSFVCVSGIFRLLGSPPAMPATREHTKGPERQTKQEEIGRQIETPRDPQIGSPDREDTVGLRRSAAPVLARQARGPTPAY